ncbi:Mth938-like domain-containing protein [Ramlibacter algicola]|uniref:Mth938-like domain-containing protein n=1 Tax=Ramlibacter algicola TaxID=2795217 RepID=A0A934Q1U3_9BURK|nr:Mth938-like domain-containing protein [Ramlibacter algicola]MBK0393062.1 Mth938-like domain-containing protein [Ramlibacter algicola]
MKLQPDKFDVQAITGYGPGWVGVGTERFTHSMVVGSRGDLAPWGAARFEDLGPEHFARLLDLQPEIVIFGSGDRIRFPRPAWLRPLVERGIGLETMDTQAACRTYNVLAQEGRHVAAALLIEASG